MQYMSKFRMIVTTIPAMFWILLVLCVLYSSASLVHNSIVGIGGIFNALSSDEDVRYAQSQYLSAFLMAVNEINNKTDGIYDDLLPHTQLKVVVRHADSAKTLAQEVVDLLEHDTLRENGERVSAVVSAADFGSYDASVIDDIFTQSQTVQVVTRLSHPDVGMGPVGSYPYNIQLAPQPMLQALVWQSMLCQYGYTEISLYYLDDIFGERNVELLLNGYYCPITVVTSHAISPRQRDFTSEIIQAHNSLSVVQMLFLDLNTAVPFLQQAHHYGLLRIGHQLILNSELIVPELWKRLDEDAAEILNGAFAIQYSPITSLERSIGRSFIQRFRNIPDVHIDDICDASLDDSAGSHYLYRNADGSRCAGLNHSSFQAPPDFSPQIGLTYDAVIILAKALHQVFYVENQTSVNSTLLRSAIISENAFSGVSGSIDITSGQEVCGHVRQSGFVYGIYGFISGLFEESNRTSGFRFVANWTDEHGIVSCRLEDPRCTRHIYNTHDGLVPPIKARYVDQSLPHVLKVGVLFNRFREDGTVDEASVQQLAAFLMAVKEINDKTDGIADKMLPYTKIVVSLRSAPNVIDTQQEAAALASHDFGSGVDVLVSRVEIMQTMAAYAIQRYLNTAIVHFGVTSYLMENDMIAPFKIQPTHSSSFYGSALQSVLCDHYKYRRISVFVTNDPIYLNAYVELMSGEFCELSLLSTHMLERSENFKDHIARAKDSGARVFVLLTDPQATAVVVREGVESGLFGFNRQVFLHTSAVSVLQEDVQLSNKFLHGFIGIHEAPNYNLNTSGVGKAFLSRWKKQQSTAGRWINGKLHCDTTRDDNDHTHLYRSQPTFSDDITCAGLNFSSFADDGSDLMPYVGHSYDTAMLIGHAFHKLIYEYGAPTNNPYLVYGMMLQGVQFEGVSGPVKMYDATETPEILGKGTRRHGEHFELVNFVRSEKYLNGTYAKSPLVNSIGVWELNSRFSYCNKQLMRDCASPIYFTEDNSPPEEMRPIVILSPPVSGIRACSMILLSLTIIFAWIYLKSKRRVMKRAYCTMLPVVCLGALAITCRLWLCSYAATSRLCGARLVLFYSGMTMFYGPLVLTSMHRLYAPSTPKPSMHRWRMTQLIITIVSIASTVVVAVPGVQYDIGYDDVVVDNQVIRYPMCMYRNLDTSNALMIPHGLALIYGLYCAYRAKDKHDPLNEVRICYVVLLLIVGVALVVYPAWAMLDIKPSTETTIVEYNIAGVFTVCLTLLMLNKLFELYTSDVNNEESVRRKVPTIEDILTQGRGKCSSTVRVLMADMKLESRVQLCHQQIGEWMTLLMQEQDMHRSSDSCVSENSGRASSYVSPAPAHQIFPFRQRPDYISSSEPLPYIPEDEMLEDMS